MQKSVFFGNSEKSLEKFWRDFCEFLGISGKIPNKSCRHLIETDNMCEPDKIVRPVSETPREADKLHRACFEAFISKK